MKAPGNRASGAGRRLFTDLAGTLRHGRSARTLCWSLAKSAAVCGTVLHQFPVLGRSSCRTRMDANSRVGSKPFVWCLTAGRTFRATGECERSTLCGRRSRCQKSADPIEPDVSMLKVALLALGFISCPLAHAVAEQDQPKSRLPSMTVPADATREVVPDVAILRLSVSVEQPTASAAAEETARSSQAVLAELKAQGIDPRNLKTAVTLSPVFDEQRGPQGHPLKRTLRGYQARNALTVRLRDTAQAGALARALIDKGANAFEGISFEVSKNKALIDELRIEATKEAIRKAKLYAQAAEVRLGSVLNIEPDTDIYMGQADMPRRAPQEGLSTTIIPIEPGVERLSARVSVTFEILP